MSRYSLAELKTSLVIDERAKAREPLPPGCFRGQCVSDAFDRMLACACRLHDRLADDPQAFDEVVEAMAGGLDVLGADFDPAGLWSHARGAAEALRPYKGIGG